jgi:dienelactone hydrolase
MPTAARLASIAVVLAAILMPAEASAETVSFVTADHLRVYADYEGGAKESSRPIILLFHQANSNGGEYTNIAKHLNGLGFDTLAVDLRSGGTAYGRPNRTIAATGEPGKPMDAVQDMEGAVDWAERLHRTKIIAWGSSFSASLVFVLAAADPGVKAIIAFSPAEYFPDPIFVHAAAARVHQPVLVSSASDPDEIDAATSIIDNTSSTVKVQIKPKQATHGSATLNGPSAAAIWPIVDKFLASQK